MLIGVPPAGRQCGALDRFNPEIGLRTANSWFSSPRQGDAGHVPAPGKSSPPECGLASSREASDPKSQYYRMSALVSALEFGDYRSLYQVGVRSRHRGAE